MEQSLQECLQFLPQYIPFTRTQFFPWRTDKVHVRNGVPCLIQHRFSPNASNTLITVWDTRWYLLFILFSSIILGSFCFCLSSVTSLNYQVKERKVDLHNWILCHWVQLYGREVSLHKHQALQLQFFQHENRVLASLVDNESHFLHWMKMIQMRCLLCQMMQQISRNEVNHFLMILRERRNVLVSVARTETCQMKLKSLTHTHTHTHTRTRTPKHTQSPGWVISGN